MLQILANLIGNALKFTPEGGRVTLRASKQADAMHFTIQDTGAGIKAAHLPHIFEPYWTADESGTGLGLFIAQGIVQAHGGRLQVETHPGTGTSFSFMIPHRLSPQTEPAPSPKWLKQWRRKPA